MPTTTIPVTNITSTRSSGALQAGDVVDIILTLSENLTIWDQRPVLSMRPSTAGGFCGYANYVEGSGTNTWKFEYIVPANMGISNLTVANTMGGSNSAWQRDSINSVFITLGIPESGVGSLAVNKSFTASTSGPTVAASTVEVNLSAGSYTAGTQMMFTVTYPEPLKFLSFEGGTGNLDSRLMNTLTVVDQSNVTIGGNFIYYSGSGTDTWKYVGDAGSALASQIRVSGFNLSHAHLCKLDGTPCSVSIPTHGSAGAFSTTKTVALTGTVLSTVSATTTTNSISGTFGTGQAVTITTVLNSALTLGTGPNPTMQIRDGIYGLAIGEATYASGSGTTVWTWNYTIPVGVRIDCLAPHQINFNGNTVAYTRRIQGPFPNGNVPNNSRSLRAFTKAQSTNVATILADGEYDAGEVIDVVVTWPFALSWTGGSGPTIPLRDENGSSIGASATYLSGNGTNTWTFSYTTQAGVVASRLRTGVINANGASFTNTSLGTAVTLNLRDIGINTFVWDHAIELTGDSGVNPLVIAKIKTRGFNHE